jgi:hypothetical protein
VKRIATTALLALGLCGPAAAGYVSSWQASSGLFPDQISPPYALTDSAAANPQFVGGKLRISTSAPIDERMFYGHSGSVLDTSGAFYVEASVQLVSGSSLSASRAPIVIAITTSPGVGNSFFIDHDAMFFALNGATAGPSHLRDTNDGFHTYRIQYDGLQTLTLLYDTVPTPLVATTFNDPSFNGLQPRINWGEGTVLEFGTSDWEYFTHNALAVPEPQSYALLLAGLVLLGFFRRRAAKPSHPRPARSSA